MDTLVRHATTVASTTYDCTADKKKPTTWNEAWSKLTAGGLNLNILFSCAEHDPTARPAFVAVGIGGNSEAGEKAQELIGCRHTRPGWSQSIRFVYPDDDQTRAFLGALIWEEQLATAGQIVTSWFDKLADRGVVGRRAR